MRVRFAVDMNSKKRNLNNLHSSPKKNIIYESPYKVYVGNLSWDVKPGDLRNLFSRFGTVVSAKVLNDRRAGKSRVYGFLSFSSAAERDASISLDGTVKFSLYILWSSTLEFHFCCFDPFLSFIVGVQQQEACC